MDRNTSVDCDCMLEIIPTASVVLATKYTNQRHNGGNRDNQLRSKADDLTKEIVSNIFHILVYMHVNAWILCDCSSVALYMFYMGKPIFVSLGVGLRMPQTHFQNL